MEKSNFPHSKTTEIDQATIEQIKQDARDVAKVEKEWSSFFDGVFSPVHSNYAGDFENIDLVMIDKTALFNYAHELPNIFGGGEKATGMCPGMERSDETPVAVVNDEDTATVSGMKSPERPVSFPYEAYLNCSEEMKVGASSSSHPWKEERNTDGQIEASDVAEMYDDKQLDPADNTVPVEMEAEEQSSVPASQDDSTAGGSTKICQLRPGRRKRKTEQVQLKRRSKRIQMLAIAARRKMLHRAVKSVAQKYH
uniref:Uncharacterized protein n=1 Tax=Anopheles culicifacies TaxID=139723 RepID=A0A182LYY3_9DIPT